MRLSPLVATLAWLVACTDPTPFSTLDADGDGALTADDCDDGNSAVSPGADELCNGIDDNCDGEVDEGLLIDVFDDADADGFGDAATQATACSPLAGQVTNGDDCDDADASSNPGTVEVCDGTDNDCDTLVDNEPIDGAMWYADVDEDGYGADGSGRRLCGIPDGLVAIDGDCSDAAPLVHPGLPDDDCNSIDNDCNGVVDDGAPAWYADADSDGYGDPTVVVHACVQPSLHADNALDCDDTEDTVNPDAAETCDGTDQDCDGLIDDEPVDGDLYWLDSDGDGFGDPLQDTLACSRPSAHTANDGDCNDTDPDIRPSAAEVCNDGIDNDCDPAIDPCVHDVWLDDTPASIIGSNGHQLGLAMVTIDLDNNGVDELVIGNANSSEGAVNGGHLELYEGPFIQDQATQLVPTWESDVTREQLGTTLANLGDVGGDGLDDLAVAAFSSDGDYVDGGAVYVFEQVGAGGSTSDARLHVHPTEAAELLGFSLVGGMDLVGGAEGDLIFGSYTWNSNQGYVAIMDGTATGELSTASADALIEGRAPGGESTGYRVGAGDFDGDDIPEVAIGAFNDEHSGGNSTGVVFLVEGPFSGTTDTDDARTAIAGAANDDRLGWGLIVSDLNGDGVADLVASSGYHDGAGINAGAIYVFHGPLGNGLDDVSSADAMLTGVVDVDLQIGFAPNMTDLGDVNGDGEPDLAASQYFVDSVTGSDDSGVCHIYYGPFAGTQSAYDGSVGRISGSNGHRPWPCLGAAALGDQDGDGLNDFAIGVPYWDEGGSGDTGGVWFIAGQSL